MAILPSQLLMATVLTRSGWYSAHRQGEFWKTCIEFTIAEES